MNGTAVSAIVVSYNVRNLLMQCLESLQDAYTAGHLSEIIVVDNASADGSPAAVRERFPDVTLIDAPNHGYGAGANLGMDAAAGDYVLVLNPDTVVPTATVERLTDFMRLNPDVGLCAPKLRYPDGRTQPSRRRFPSRLTPVFESTVFQQWWSGNPWSRLYYVQDRPDDEVQEVDWLVGACLLVRQDAIVTSGVFDPAFWMYCEEIEWCWRIRHHGWKVFYIPDVEIMHYEGASTAQDVPQRQLAFDRSRIELQRRLYGNATSLVVEAGIRLGYLIQLAVEGMKWMLGHRRDLRRQRMHLYWSLLSSSMRTRDRIQQ